LTVPVRKVHHIDSELSVPSTSAPLRLAIRSRLSSTIDKNNEWILSDDIYDEIVKLIYAWGMVMERHPSTYSNKRENDLRDLFLLLLTPHFEYAGGETFN